MGRRRHAAAEARERVREKARERGSEREREREREREGGSLTRNHSAQEQRSIDAVWLWHTRARSRERVRELCQEGKRYICV